MKSSVSRWPLASLFIKIVFGVTFSTTTLLWLFGQFYVTRAWWPVGQDQEMILILSDRSHVRLDWRWKFPSRFREAKLNVEEYPSNETSLDLDWRSSPNPDHSTIDRHVQIDIPGCHVCQHDEMKRQARTKYIRFGTASNDYATFYRIHHAFTATVILIFWLLVSKCLRYFQPENSIDESELQSANGVQNSS